MTFAYRYRKQIFFIVVALVFLGSFSFFVVSNLLKKAPKKEQTLVLTTKKEEKKDSSVKEKENIALLQVDIKGAVHTPGIYSVQEGSRVIDVIRLAGDLQEDADTSVLNLSKKVFDEMVIIVYTKDEVSHFKEVKEQEAQVYQQCVDGSTNALSNDACIENNQERENFKISLNTATKEELLTLSGIGDAKAEAIIKYREEHNGFQSIEELKEVTGIGESLFNQIKENITL